MNRRRFLWRALSSAAMAILSGPIDPMHAAQLPELDATSYRKLRRHAQLTNCRVAYVQRGHGRVALFLHGFPLNSFQWRGVIVRLSAHRRCVAPDMMGLGYTESGETQEITPSTQADMLSEFLDKLRIRTVDLVANDTGGEVAQLFVAQYPQRVRTLLLSNCDVDTNSPPPSFKPIVAAAQKGILADSFERLLADKAIARSSRGLGPFYANPADLTDEAIDYYLSSLVSSPLRKKQLNHFAASFKDNPLIAIEPALRLCAAPTRILWALEDTTFDVTWANWLDKTFAHSRGVRRIEGAKLFFPEEIPDVVAEEALKLWSS